MFLKSKKGFSLVELMIVASVLSALLAIVISTYAERLRTTNVIVCRENRRVIEHAEQRFLLDKAAHSASIRELVDEGYLRTVPRCPQNGIYTWAEYDVTDPLFQSVIGCSLHGTESPQGKASAKDKKK